MRKIYKESVVSYLDNAVSSKIPLFKKIKISPKVRTGTLVSVDHLIYEQRLSNISFFLHFINLPQEDRLQLEVGWSELNLFPAKLSRMTVLDFNEADIMKKDFIVDFEHCYHAQMGTSPEPWYLWRCREVIPEINWEKKDDLEHRREFEIQSKKFRDAYIAEAIRKVSEEEAMENTRIALSGLVSEIENYVIPIFESKLKQIESMPRQDTVNPPSQKQ